MFLSIWFFDFSVNGGLQFPTPLKLGVAMWLVSGQWDVSGSGMCHFQVEAFNCWCSTLQPFLPLPEQILDLGEVEAA